MSILLSVYLVFEVVLLPSLEKKLKDRRFRSHALIISNLVEKLELMGEGAVKVLAVQDQYLLGEMKVKRPPYRLYVVVDRRRVCFYLVDWEHKSSQESVIDRIKGKLAFASEYTFERLFGL